jgi:multidrug efflux pump
VSVIYTALNQYHVVMEVAPEWTRSPGILGDVYVPAQGSGALTSANSGAGIGVLPPAPVLPLRDASTGASLAGSAHAMVPLPAISTVSETATATLINHQDTALAATISFNLAPGRSLSEAAIAIAAASADIGVPANVHGGFQGTAKAFQSSLLSELFLVIAALVAIYLVLGVLYESYVHPLTVLSTLPSAGLGAVLALLLFNIEFSIIALIGVILLIGIVKKNAILVIDFALEAERTRGLPARAAIREAALLRFRPILMTTLAAALGALPLAIGFGVGADLRRPLGISIVGGLIVSQLLTLVTTPVVYLYLDRFRRRRRPAPADRPALRLLSGAVEPS